MCFLTANTHLKLLERVVSCVCFLTRGVFEYNIAHHQSVAVLSVLSMISCNLMHSLYGDLPLPYVQAQVTHGS